MEFPNSSIGRTNLTLGTKPSFEELYSENRTKILHFITNLTRDRAIAEDLTQETFISAYKYWDRFVPTYRPINWLLHIARNKVLDWVKKKARTETELYDSSGDYNPFPEFDSFDTIRDASLALNHKEYLVIRMYYFERRTDQEIAHAFNRESTWSHRTRHGALNKMRTYLEAI